MITRVVRLIDHGADHGINPSPSPSFIGFKGQTEVLARLFQLVSNNMITVPLYNPAQVSNPNTSNADFLREYVTTLLQNAFPHLQGYVIYTYSIECNFDNFF